MSDDRGTVNGGCRAHLIDSRSSDEHPCKCQVLGKVWISTAVQRRKQDYLLGVCARFVTEKSIRRRWWSNSVEFSASFAWKETQRWEDSFQLFAEHSLVLHYPPPRNRQIQSHGIYLSSCQWRFEYLWRAQICKTCLNEKRREEKFFFPPTSSLHSPFRSRSVVCCDRPKTPRHALGIGFSRCTSFGGGRAAGGLRFDRWCDGERELEQRSIASQLSIFVSWGKRTFVAVAVKVIGLLVVKGIDDVNVDHHVLSNARTHPRSSSRHWSVEFTYPTIAHCN